MQVIPNDVAPPNIIPAINPGPLSNTSPSTIKSMTRANNNISIPISNVAVGLLILVIPLNCLAMLRHALPAAFVTVDAAEEA